MNQLAPVVLFVYCRPDHTRRTVEALQKNTLAKASELFIFSDSPKTAAQSDAVKDVRRYARQIDGFKRVQVTEKDQNWGLAKSIIDGVTEVVDEHGVAIVLEDDLVTSPHFLTYMNRGLDVYRHREDVLSVTGFSFPSKFMGFSAQDDGGTYLNIRAMSWSWATWSNRWKDVDWEVRDFASLNRSRRLIREFNRGGTDLIDLLRLQMSGAIDSWYIRWTYHAYKHKLLTVYPNYSLVNNIGHDGTGVHCGSTTNSIFNHREFGQSPDFEMKPDISLDPAIVQKFNRAFNIRFRSRVKQFVKKALGMGQ